MVFQTLINPELFQNGIFISFATGVLTRSPNRLYGGPNSQQQRKVMAKRHWNREGDLESLFLRLEELVLANSGEDEFEEVFKLLVAKLWDERSGKRPRFRARETEEATYAGISGLLREAENTWPGILGTDNAPRLSPAHLQVCVEAFSRHTVLANDLQALDGFFEYLVSRGSKGAKGQYFTPRHVVELCVRLLRPRRSESVCDPGCGSGGFLLHAMRYVHQQEGLSAAEAREYCRNHIWGFDIDGRAVRVAKALMLVAGDGSANFVRLNSLSQPGMGGLFQLPSEDAEDDGPLTIEDVCRGRRRRHVGFDVILTNPPFAGEVRERHILDGYAVSRGRRRVERDILFIERCVRLLRPGGRLGIVLPHNKFAGSAFRHVRDWLFGEAQILGVVSLGRNTFLPHTHQKASVLLARRREKGERKIRDERVFFAVSERSGKDSKGRYVVHEGASATATLWDRVDHDFQAITDAFHGSEVDGRQVDHNGNSALCSTRATTSLGADLILAPERYDPRRSLSVAKGATPLGDIVEVFNATTSPKQMQGSRVLVLDTSDAREGIVSCRRGPVSAHDIGSTKKLVKQGCVLISRLRPYLRQIAYVDGEVPSWGANVPMYCSTEFFVLRSIDDQPISFLVPFLLSGPVQTVLAASQEGGHHPRFNQNTLLDLPIPHLLMERREEDSRQVEEAVAMFRRSERLRDGLVEMATGVVADA